MQLQFGRDKTPGANPGAADLRQHKTALAIAGHRAHLGAGHWDAVVAGLKASGVGLHRPVQAIGLPLPITQPNLGCTVVRWGDGRGDVLEGLPALNLRGHAQVPTAPAQNPCGGQQTLGQGQARAGEITPIVVVADPVQVQAQTDAPHAVQASVHRAIVLAGPAPTGLVTQAVRGHQVQPGLAAVVALQITELGVHRHTAFAHQVGGHGGIAVGRDVEIIGLGQLQPIVGGDAHHGWQQARLAITRHREGDGGNAQHRHVLKAQLHPLGPHRGLFFVQIQAGGFEHPCRQPLWPGRTPAGGVTGLTHDRALIIHKVDLRRLPVGTTFIKLKSGLRQGALKTVYLQGELGAGQHTAWAVQAHLTRGLHHVLALVKGQSARLNAHARLANAGLPLDHQVQIGPHAQALPLQINCPLLLLALGDGLLQHRAAAQDQALNRGCGHTLQRCQGLSLRTQRQTHQRDTWHPQQQHCPHHGLHHRP